MFFVPAQFSNGKRLVPAFLVRGLMSYSVIPAVLALLQLLVRKLYHPKLFLLAFALCVCNFGAAVALAMFDFHGTIFG